MGRRLTPLESNPDVLNEFSAKLGLEEHTVAFCDVLGLDDELLEMVPQVMGNGSCPIRC